MTALIAFLAIFMLLFGTINTVTTKLQDITVVGVSSTGKVLTFSHPAFQSACMFLGEFSCLLPYLCTLWSRRRKEGQDTGESSQPRKTWRQRLAMIGIFALPALLDSGATTLLNIGLILTYASVFQMLRGTMVVFTGVLTVLVLKRKLHTHHWLGIVLISAGAAIVGASRAILKMECIRSVVSPKKHVHHHSDAANSGLWWAFTAQKKGPDTASAPLLGDLLIVGAQVLQASQFIIEEKYLAKYRVPALLAVGLEGFWGLVVCAVALPILNVVKGSNGRPLDSFQSAVQEIGRSKTLKWCTFGSIASIAFFNFFGLSVTKRLSGAGRATIDASRTALVWVFSLWIHWEHFQPLQVVGFLIILTGSSLYNELIRMCLPDTAVASDNEEQEPLLSNDEEAGPSPLTPRLDSRAEHTAPRQAALRPSHYTLARSLRAGPAALSPRSLVSPANSPPIVTNRQ